MAIEFQTKKSWMDFLLRRPWRESKTAPTFPDKILSYNSVYLMVLCGLNIEGEDSRWIHSIEFSGKIEKYLTIEKSKKSRWMHDYIAEFIKYEKRPWFIVNGDTNTLSRLRLTGKELRAVQGREIAVYFYEPLFFRGAKSYDASVHVTFPELEWLEDFNYNHGGQLKIVVYVCDYDLASYLRKWKMHPGLEVRTFDIFVSAYVFQHAHPLPWTFPWAPESVGKKFICLNFRYDAYREYVIGYLFGKGYHQDGHISFFHSHREQVFRDLLPFPPERGPEWRTVRAGIERMQNLLPLVLDTTRSKTIEADESVLPDWKSQENVRNDQVLYKFYQDSFLCIVNETRYGTANGEISEKTLIPIMLKRPFVIVGGPHMIRYMKELGFETFSDFWDESYDEIEDHALRMEKIFMLLDDLLGRPLEELQSLLVRMQALLDRNWKHLFENVATKLLRQIEKDAGPRRS